jgi:hypothetical protein
MEQEFYFSNQQQALGSDLFTLVTVAKRKTKKMSRKHIVEQQEKR